MFPRRGSSIARRSFSLRIERITAFFHGVFANEIGLGPSRNGVCVTEANCRVPSSIRRLSELHMVSEDVWDGQYSLGSSSGGLEINYCAHWAPI